MADRIIDVWTHFMPPGYMEKFASLSRERGMVRRMGSIPAVYDLDVRRRLVGQWPGYGQVIAPGGPGPERLGEPADRPGLARFTNEGLAELVRKYPDEFPAFLAAVPLDDVAAAVTELSYAVDKLGARGVQLHTNVLGRPLDGPEFEPLWAELSRRGTPTFIHPMRGPGFADYEAEQGSRYEIWQVMGWPYETGACIARLVFSGVMDRHPGLKIVTHHLGGIIPYLEGRIGPLFDQLGSRTEGGGDADVLKLLKSRPIDYFRRIYGDTAVGGAAGVIRCGLEFFGPDRVMFASDCPFDPEGGPGFIRDGMKALDSIALEPEVLAKIRAGNAQSLLSIE